MQYVHIRGGSNLHIRKPGTKTLTKCGKKIDHIYPVDYIHIEGKTICPKCKGM